ncbi:nitroreductase [Candidatus Woesearchaeota archaeon CG_4_10_14_0_2_um_filter_33_10]|nr:MAG: hypothetical protein AUJ83_01090 [Candidatus Woesearchaeota archaeon CG1_02_33_12]PIN78975.1 MAG: nitroreductase [Candidatus Woesearchaeota archaeon CG10_big_fil_rev_8_21_14_0_10_33_12]PIU72511.1 MAG: nitroreductase [Candidatus Woesearchaeota archaeon CG06_land_8_20_14_3_00_33_13]PIZ53350.1 MAG: nitroreductase [Candidatus Woesearchaeota archaeon CG_4_10_14_0_2_um_filter_33_10]
MLNMEVFECISTRRSIRKYLDIPVEWDKVGTILEAGRLAPSSGNIQDYNFIVVQDEDKRKTIAEASLRQHWMSKAPVYIIVCADLKKSERFYGVRGSRLYSIQNCAAAIENMLLTAHSLDLGACWVGAFDENVVSRVLNIPDSVRPQAIITIGYSDEKPTIPQRYPLTTVAFLEKYGNRIKDMAAVLHDYSLVMERNLKKGKIIFEKTGKKTGSLLTEKGKELAKKIKEKLGK